MFHQHNDAPDARDYVHGPAHSFHPLARNHPVGQVAALGDLHGAEDGHVDVSAANHGEGVCTRKRRSPRIESHGLFSGVDKVRVHLMLAWERTHPEQAVFRLQDDADSVGNVVGHQRRNSDSQVDAEAVLQLPGGAGGHLLTSPCHWSISPGLFSFQSAFQDWDDARADEQKYPVCESHPDPSPRDRR